jgi:hypothetical protein
VKSVGVVPAIETLVRDRPEALVSIDHVVEYRTPATTVGISRAATRLVLGVTLLVPATFVAFRLLRNHQLSLPDPYNNPYTNWSAACLLAFFGLALTDFVLLVVLRRRVPRWIRYLGALVLLASGAYIAWRVIGMLRLL